MLMARKLRHAQVGFAALNPYTLHPVEIAGQIAVLDHVSNGRAYLGLAKGAWFGQIGVNQPRPVATLREAALCVRHLLRRDPAAFNGEIFTLQAGSVLNYAPLRESVPLMIGTWGAQTAAMAGEIADEIKVGGSANPMMVGTMRAHLAMGEQRAGRTPGSVGVCLGAVTVIDEDREAARAWVRKEAALYVPVVAPLDPSFDDTEWLARVKQLDAIKDYQAISSMISDAQLDKLAFAGNVHDVIRQCEKLRAAGCSRIEFGTPHGLQSADGIRLLGEQVLPAF